MGLHRVRSGGHCDGLMCESEAGVGVRDWIHQWAYDSIPTCHGDCKVFRDGNQKGAVFGAPTSI